MSLPISVADENPFHPLSCRLVCRVMVSALLGVMLFLLNPAWAGARDINWTSLNLSSDQSSRIEQLEEEWKQTYADLSPQIESEREELKVLLKDPDSDPNQIMQVQRRINEKRMLLHREAMKIYLKKKDQLNTDQRNRLQQMMGF